MCYFPSMWRSASDEYSPKSTTVSNAWAASPSLLIFVSLSSQFSHRKQAVMLPWVRYHQMQVKEVKLGLNAFL